MLDRPPPWRGTRLRYDLILRFKRFRLQATQALNTNYQLRVTSYESLTFFSFFNILRLMRKSASGQALLVVLLILGVALTTGLSLVARLTTDISISEDEVSSGQAFEAAEAGVEEALRALEAGENTPENLSLSPGGTEANVTISVEELSGEQAIKTIHSGEAATFWLNSFSLAGEDFPSYKEGEETKTLSYTGERKVELCWKGTDKLEAAVYYQEGSDYKVARYYLDSTGSCPLEDENDGQKAELDFTDIATAITNVKFINVRFYGDANETVTVAMAGVGDNLPRQGTIITSEATVNNVARQIVISRGWPVPPSFFDFALFSGGALAK